jgi:putative ABC transport system substrate-binding protein
VTKKGLAFATITGTLLLVCFVDAQLQASGPTIGVLSAVANPDPVVEAFRQGLRDLGYLEGKNIQVEYRYAEGKLDRLSNLVAELVQLKVDVLVLGSLPAIRAAERATKTLPIVIVTSVDPVAAGLVDSLAHPGRNITGRAVLTRDLSAKRLELFKESIPTLSRVGVLWDFESEPSTISYKEYEAAARPLKIELHSLAVRGPNPDLDGVFQAGAKARIGALLTITNGLIRSYHKQIADLAIKKRLASMHERSQYVESGGLMSYSAVDTDEWRRAAIYVDKILKGAKPADLPVEQPMKFELVINLKTAKQISVTIPPNVLARADKVIR